MVEVPVKMYLSALLKKARESVTPMALLSGPVKEATLRTLAELIAERTEDLLAANREDVLAVGKSLEGEKDKDRVKAAVNRVKLAEDDLKLMADRLQRVADLDDPAGQVVEQRERPNGMQVRRVRVPIGVLGIIFGFVGRSQIRRSGGTQKGMGMAIAGIIIGVVLIVAAVLFVVLLATSDDCSWNDGRLECVTN